MLAVHPPVPAKESESDWVDGQLVRELMSTAKVSQYLALSLSPIVVLVLYGVVPTWELALWTVTAWSVAIFRLWIMYHYERRYADGDTELQRAFIRRFGPWWPVSAVVWGLSALLFLDRTPLVNQFTSLLMIAGVCAASMGSFAAHRATQRNYILALSVTMLAVILWKIVVDHQFAAPSYHYWLVLLVILNCVILLKTGEQLHLTSRRNAELRYRNDQLIASLTRQTDAALAAVKVKNRFLASAAHDIRQPVHALALYADWLRNEPDLACDITPKILEATKAVNSLFDSLFDLARLDAGQVQVRVERIDVVRLLKDLELQYRPLAQARGLQFRLHLSPGCVLSDQILLKRVLGNLLGNAIKYTESGGVLVASRRSGRGMRIEVWDTGVGIAADQQRTVFDEFYKVPTHRGTDDGFGLGLSIVARLLTLLGHSVELTSRPGKGTVLRVTVHEGCA